MPRIDELFKEENQEPTLPPNQRLIFEALESHPEMVFENKDPDLRELTGIENYQTLSFGLWHLHRRQLIDKEVFRDTVYYGSKKAIEDLRKRQGDE